MRGCGALAPDPTLHTHDAVLHAEAQLELEVRPLDEDGGDGGAAHDAQFDLHLSLQPLEHKKTPQNNRSKTPPESYISFYASPKQAKP